MNRYTSDLFSYLGTLILWVFWPSFNAYAVFGDGRHRCPYQLKMPLQAN